MLTLTNFNFDSNSGWTGKGLKFDGVNDYTQNLSVENIVREIEDKIVTIECIEHSIHTSERIWSPFFFLGNASTCSCLQVSHRRGMLYLGTYENDNNKIYSTATTEKRHHSFVCSPSGDIECYLNGVFLQSFKLPKPFSISSSKINHMKVGALGNSIIDVFVGQIHSIKIYNVALTPEEIQQNYEFEQSIDRTTASTYPMLQEQKSYGIGLSNQLSEEKKSTFRLSVDGTKFVAGLRYCEGLEVEEFTYSEIQFEMEKEEWASKEELE